MKKLQIVFLFVFLVGCSENQTVFPTLLPKTSTPILIPTSTITFTPSPSPSETAIPSTSTPITSIPTLLPKEKEAYLLNLIETNGGCKLPCFLGIQPGVSTWEDVRKVEAPLYFREKYIPDNSNSTLLYTYVEKRIEGFDVTLWGSDDSIERITVNAKIYQPFSPQEYLPRFAKAMQQYSLPNILSEYGMPSQILLNASGQVEPGAGTWAEVLLFYRDLGFIADYSFTNVVTQNQNTFALHTCLNYDHLEIISLYLQAPDNNIPLEQMINDVLNTNYIDTLSPVEKVTALSSADFYNLFNGVTKTVCFDVQ